jgi:hypothetical protein
VNVVRQNLLTQAGYAPYCGAQDCAHDWPRARWDGDQFQCDCGWRSALPASFVAEYRAKWGLGA